MKYYLSSILFFLCTASVHLDAEQPFIDTVRTAFYRAVENESETDKLLAAIIKAYPQSSPPLFEGYIGALETLKGKFAYNPYAKYHYVTQGLSKINRAVQAEPENLEIRFIRFSVLHHLPPLFGIEKSRNEDAETICKIIASGKTSEYPPQLLTGVVDFMLSSGRLTGQQKQMISGKTF